jgi:DNA-binding phage protein
MPTRSYHDELLKQPKDPREAAEYLNACVEDSEEAFLLGPRDVVEARGGVDGLSRTTELNRENLYRSLSKKGILSFQAFRQFSKRWEYSFSSPRLRSARELPKIPRG